MRRRPDDSIDPLDLLLDTVCNLFAVIIFIAVFAAILVDPVRENSPRHPGPVETEDRQPERVVTIAIEDSSLAEADASIAELRAELDARRSAVDLLESLEARIVERSGDVSDLQSSLTADAESLEDRLKDVTAVQKVPMRTPRRDTQRDAIPVSLYLWRDRLYLAHDFRGWSAESDPDRAWLTYMGEDRLDPAMVRRNGSSIRSLPDGSLQFQLTMRRDGGIPIKDPESLRQDPRWHAGIGGLIRGRHIIYISVRQDAFAAFGVVRSELARLGFGYDVFISPGDDGVFETIWVTGLPTTQ